MRELHPIAWFSKRELDHIPRHFTKTTTPQTDESYVWVLSNLQGRFGKSSESSSPETLSLEWVNIFYFEDPAEAMMYELRWSGS